MKKIFFNIISLILLLGATACSQSEEPSAYPVPAKVSFSVGVNPGNATRAFGDGSSAKTLDYAVYSNHDGQFDFVYNDRTQFGADNSANVDVTLAMGEKYRVVFFAHCGEGATIDFENATLTLDYDAIANQMAAGLKDFDCFYKYVDIDIAQQETNHEVTLQRPVAQFNWGTKKPIDDATIQKAFPKGIRTRLKATLYNKMNLLTGVVDPESTVNFAPTKGMAPIMDSAFPVEGYEWLNAFYVLVPAAVNSTALVDASLEVWNGDDKCLHTVKVTNVPYCRNFRTNIFGNIITSSIGGNVGIDPSYDGEFNVQIR